MYNIFHCFFFFISLPFLLFGSLLVLYSVIPSQLQNYCSLCSVEREILPREYAAVDDVSVMQINIIIRFMGQCPYFTLGNYLFNLKSEFISNLIVDEMMCMYYNMCAHIYLITSAYNHLIKSQPFISVN